MNFCSRDTNITIANSLYLRLGLSSRLSSQLRMSQLPIQNNTSSCVREPKNSLLARTYINTEKIRGEVWVLLGVWRCFGMSIAGYPPSVPWWWQQVPTINSGYLVTYHEVQAMAVPRLLECPHICNKRLQSKAVSESTNKRYRTAFEEKIGQLNSWWVSVLWMCCRTQNIEKSSKFPRLLLSHLPRWAPILCTARMLNRRVKGSDIGCTETILTTWLRAYDCFV